MIIREVAASLYPWDIADEGIGPIADTLRERSLVNSIYLVGVMHYEKRPLTSLFYTHNEKRKFYLPENSRAYYHLDMNSFKDTRLKPCFSERDFLKNTDWLDVLSKEGRRQGMSVGVELSHTIYDTAVAEQLFPETLQRDINGNIIHNAQAWLCSNHPEVHEYQRAMFQDTVKNHDVDFVQTCLLTFLQGNSAKAPWYYDTWMDMTKESSLGKLLGLSRGGCFCDSCKAKALKLGYDWEVILRDMKRLYEIANATPYIYQESLMEHDLLLGSNVTDSLLFTEFPGLLDFIRFRIDSITELFKDIYESVHAVRPDIDFRYNNHAREPEYQGVSFKHIAPYLDSVRDSDYAEQWGAPDNFVYKRNTMLKVRRGIGCDKRILAAFAVRPNATPELIHRSIHIATELGVDGLSLGHYDGSHIEHLDAVKEGIRLANITIKP